MNRTNKKAYWLSMVVATSFVISACNQQNDDAASDAENQQAKAETAKEAVVKTEVVKKQALKDQKSEDASAGEANANSLEQILDAQPDSVKARYSARHPQETLTFFEVQPGQTLVEALPGGGWYSKLILPVLGQEGKLIGADYAADMYPKFGFFKPEDLEKKKTWVEDWTKQASSWRSDSDAALAAFQFGSMPDEMKGTADRVLFIRALHNLARFEDDGGYLTKALADSFAVLKSGGMVGVVQHKAPEGSADSWANGANGYLKESFVKQKMAEAGFEFVGSSEINLNPKDQPTEEDFVWRLPPSFANSRDNPELKKQYEEIGESTRMTLKFKKP